MSNNNTSRLEASLGLNREYNNGAGPYNSPA